MKYILILLTLILTAPAQDLFVFAGQSNMQGYGLTSELTLSELDNEGIYGWDWLYKSWRHNPDPTKHEYVFHPERLQGHRIHDLRDNFGPELSALKVIRKVTGKRVYFIKYAVGGSSLQQWETTHYPLLDREVKRTGRSVEAFFWMQGETDDIYQSQANTYKDRLLTFIDKVGAPFIAGQISQRWPYASTVRSAYEDMNYEGTLSLVGTDDLGVYRGPDSHPDGLNTAHYNTDAQRKLGERYAISYLHCQGSNEYPVVTGDFNKDGHTDYLMMKLEDNQSVHHFEVQLMVDFELTQRSKLIVAWTGNPHYRLPRYFIFNGISDPDNDGDDDICHTEGSGLWIWQIEYPYITKSEWNEY